MALCDLVALTVQQMLEHLFFISVPLHEQWKYPLEVMEVVPKSGLRVPRRAGLNLNFKQSRK